MKYKLFYSSFFIFLLLILPVSCSQPKKELSSKDKNLIAQINFYLKQSESDSLSVPQKLKYIEQSITLAKKANIDSLILKTNNKKAEIYNISKPDSALVVLQDFEKLVQSKRDTLYRGYSHLNFGDYYYNIKQDSTSFSSYNKAKIAFENSKDSSLVVYSLLMMSKILKEKNDYYDMEAVNVEALNFVNATNRNYNFSAIYTNLGISLKETYDYEKSLTYYKKARKYAEDDSSKALIDNNIGVLYTLSEQPQKAIVLLSGLEKTNIFHENEKFKARVLCNIGHAYFKLNDSKAVDYFLEALSIRERIKDDYGLVTSYIHLAEYYQWNNNKISAKKYAFKSYQIATSLDIIDRRIDALAILSETESATTAGNYAATYFRLNDSINKVRQKNKNQFAKIRYDFTAQKEQNLKLKTQEAERSLKLAQSENQKLIMTFLGIIGIAVVSFRFNYLKQKQKKQLVQESYITETRIAKQLHDELANDVYHTMAFAETQDLTNSINKENLLGNLETIYNRTRNISKENSTIDTGTDYVLHLKEMMSSFSNEKINVLINGLHSMPFAAIESNKKIIIYRILQELLVNMKKHSKCTLAAISFQHNGNKLEIQYSDNGVGIVAEKIFLKNGLQNVENRIKAINGSINFDNKSHKGFKVNCFIPI